MKILFVDPCLEPGGTELHLLTRATELKKRGHQVMVASSGGLLVRRFEDNGIPHFQLDIKKKSPLHLWRGSRGLRRLLGTQEIDLINTDAVGVTLMCYLAMRFPPLQRIPLVATIPVISKGKLLKYAIAGRLLNLTCDFVITCNHTELKKLVRAKLNPFKTATIYNGVDLRKFRPSRDPAKVKAHFDFSSNTPLIGIIARLNPEKGHNIFLEAAATTLRYYPEARFLVIGSGPLSSQLQDYARTMGIDHAVVFTGYRSDIPDILAGLDIVVISSLWECLPNSLLEAMAMGRPVISTNVGGIPEVIQDGVSGLIVPPRNPEALAQAIVTLLGDSYHRTQMGDRARRTIEENFELQGMIDRLEQQYEKVVQKV